MATTLNELYSALGDQTVTDAMAGYEQGMIYQGYEKLLHDKLFNIMVFKTPIECGAQSNNSLIFNTVVEKALSSVAARKLGAEYTPANSVNEVRTFVMSQFGGSFQVDRAIMRAQGMDPSVMSIDQIPENTKSYVYNQMRSKMDAIIEAFNSNFISGNGTDPNFKGCEPYVTAGTIPTKEHVIGSVVDAATAQQIWTILNTDADEANTLVCNSAAYRMLTGMLFQMHMNNSFQKLGELNYMGISDKVVVELPDKCFTAVSYGDASTNAVIYALRIGKGARDFGIAVPNDAKVLDIVNPFSPMGSGLAVRAGMVELVGCIFPGVKKSAVLIRMKPTAAAGMNVNIQSVGGKAVDDGIPASITDGTNDVGVTSSSELMVDTL